MVLSNQLVKYSLVGLLLLLHGYGVVSFQWAYLHLYLIALNHFEQWLVFQTF